MWKEVDGIDEKPSNYETCLNDIKNILEHTVVQKVEAKKESFDDLAEEFGDDFVQQTVHALKTISEHINDDEDIYEITLNLDEDIYFRGFDHAKLMKLLSEEGRILESWWDMKSIPTLDTLDCSKSYFNNVDIFLATNKNSAEIEEVFEYIEPHEYSIKKIAKTPPPPEPVRIEEQEIKYGNRASDDVPEAEEKAKPQQRRKNDSASFVKVDTHKLDELFDSVGELVIAQNFLAEKCPS